MKYLDVRLTFYQCRNLSLSNLKLISTKVFDHGFVFEQYMGDHMRKIEKREDIDNLINKHYHVKKTDAKTESAVKWYLRFRAYPNNWKDFRNGTLDIMQFNSRTNRVRIGGLLDFEFLDERHLVDPYAQILKEIIISLYPLTKPAIGWIDNTNRNTTDEKDVLKLKLLVISWINIWGPEYVNKYGKGFLLGMPGYKTELLPDGGAFHQLSSSFVANDSKESKRIRNQVTDYCAKHGQIVKCYAPYSLPKKGPA